jgi:hypothetical protein
MGIAYAYIVLAWTFIPLIVALFECFVIKKRTEQYYEDLKGVILKRDAVIFCEPNAAVATS